MSADESAGTGQENGHGLCPPRGSGRRSIGLDVALCTYNETIDTKFRPELRSTRFVALPELGHGLA
ncbi:hypothetical protein GCM10009821_22510 [Aeromicrobium halocynthiae]|uniref:Uncharacterized protein n=1 Tax=Aeromicrobium halocynthiae TaxID=560557 RepID=A0ABP5HLS2_9ACTN